MSRREQRPLTKDKRRRSELTIPKVASDAASSSAKVSDDASQQYQEEEVENNVAAGDYKRLASAVSWGAVSPVYVAKHEKSSPSAQASSFFEKTPTKATSDTVPTSCTLPSLVSLPHIERCPPTPENKHGQILYDSPFSTGSGKEYSYKWFKHGSDHIRRFPNSPFELSIALGLEMHDGKQQSSLEKAFDEFDEWEAKHPERDRINRTISSNTLQNPQEASSMMFNKKRSSTRSPQSVARANGLLRTPVSKKTTQNSLSEFLGFSPDEDGEHYLITRIKHFACEALERGAPVNVSDLSAFDCRGILANAFFGNVIDVFVDEKEEGNLGGLNLISLMDAHRDCTVQKLLCFLFYFASPLHDEQVVFNLHSATSIDDFEAVLRNSLPLGKIKLTSGPLETPEAAIVDDSSQCQVFGNGNFQSARMGDSQHMLCPEMNVGMLYFCKIPDDSIITVRCRRFTEHTGYGASFTCLGPRDETYTQLILAVGARKRKHFERETVVRDIRNLTKAFEQAPHIVSSKEWGCGRSAGDHVHKFLLQIIAISVAQKTLRYSIPNNEPTLHEFRELLDMIYRSGCTVKELYEALPSGVPSDGWYKYLSSKLERELTG